MVARQNQLEMHNYSTWQKKVNVIRMCAGYGSGWPTVTETGVLEFTYEHNYEHNTDRATGVINDTYEPLASTKED